MLTNLSLSCTTIVLNKKKYLKGLKSRLTFKARCKMTTGDGDHKNKHGVHYMHIQPIQRYSALKINLQHT